MTSFSVKSLLWLNFWLKRIWIPVYYCVYCHFSLLVVVNVSTVKAVALRATTLAIGEAVAVKFQTLGLLTVASIASRLGRRVQQKMLSGRRCRRCIVNGNSVCFRSLQDLLGNFIYVAQTLIRWLSLIDRLLCTSTQLPIDNDFLSTVLLSLCVCSFLSTSFDDFLVAMPFLGWTFPIAQWLLLLFEMFILLILRLIQLILMLLLWLYACVTFCMMICYVRNLYVECWIIEVIRCTILRPHALIIRLALSSALFYVLCIVEFLESVVVAWLLMISLVILKSPHGLFGNIFFH